MAGRRRNRRLAEQWQAGRSPDIQDRHAATDIQLFTFIRIIAKDNNPIIEHPPRYGIKGLDTSGDPCLRPGYKGDVFLLDTGKYFAHCPHILFYGPSFEKAFEDQVYAQFF